MPEQLTERMEGVRKQLETRWRIEAEALNKSWFSNRGQFDTALAKLNAKYQQEEFKVFSEIQQQEESRQRVQELIAGPDERSRAQEADIRMELGPEAERLVFPEQRDPRDEYRELNTTMGQLFQGIKQFATSKNGKVYRSKVDEEGYYTGQPDKNFPATKQEIAGWVADVNAWSSLRQARTGAAQEMAEQGMPDPNYLQNVLKSTEEESWFKKLIKTGFAGTGIGIALRGVALRREYKKQKRRTAPIYTQPGIGKGTFAQKVVETLPQQSQGQQPTAKKKLTKQIAMNYLLQYPNKQDAMAAARADGYE